VINIFIHTKISFVKTASTVQPPAGPAPPPGPAVPVDVADALEEVLRTCLS
jgi:hypothetical protein